MSLLGLLPKRLASTASTVATKKISICLKSSISHSYKASFLPAPDLRATRLYTHGAKDSSTSPKNRKSNPEKNEGDAPKLSLGTDRERETIKLKKSGTLIRRLFKPFIPQYQAVQIGKNLYNTCQPSQAEFDAFWFKHAKMPPNFQSWFTVSLLYLWLCLVRLRAEPKTISVIAKQQLVDNFFAQVEQKIRAEGIKSGKIVNDSLKDLNSIYIGMVMALDEGFATSDAVLAAAVWRNILSSCESAEVLEATVDYIRRQLNVLDNLTSHDFITGNFTFDKTPLTLF